jgi:hypothetical protein
MNLNIKCFLIIALFGKMNSLSAQNISSETVEFQLLQRPKLAIDPNSRSYKVTVTSPYNLTAEDVVRKVKADHQNALKNYDKNVLESQKEYEQRLTDYDGEVLKAKEKFKLESAEFKKLSILEKLTMTDQGQNPKLVIPSKPQYFKPASPLYREPNLSDYTIVDNNVLASQISVDGFTRDGSGKLDIMVDINGMNFQDNAGQTFANQPTKLVVKLNGIEKTRVSFFQDYNFLSSSPSNNINQPLEEKNHLNKVIEKLNTYLNENYGFSSVKKTVKIQSVKNKGEYDDLARADIYVSTNLRKLQGRNSDADAASLLNMQKGIDIWNQTLTKIDYKDSKAVFNPKIAEFIYFNLLRLNLALNKKADAEKYLSQFQENMIHMKLSYSDKAELEKLEKDIYAL